MDVRTAFFVLLLAIFGVISMLLLFPLLQYVVAAALVAFVLYPVHETLSGFRIDVGVVELTVGPRISAGFLTIVTLVTAIFPLLILSVILFQTVRSFVAELDESLLLDRLRAVAHDLGVEEELLGSVEQYLLSEVDRHADRGLEMVVQELLRLVNVSLQMGVGLLVLIFLLYYFLVDGRTLIEWIGDVAPLDDDVREQLYGEIHRVTWAVIKSHVLIALIEGILGGIGLYLLGISNVVFWAVVMVIMSILPLIGIWLIWGPAVVHFLVIGEPFNAILLFSYGIVVLAAVDDYLRAILVDRDTGVHPAVVLIGVIGGIYLLGIIGLFVGPVLLAVFKAGLNVFADLYRVSDGDLERYPPS
ncbi:AI-2E family transporter [Halopenitus sp. H-Gu1]|uniref:AI-2E family transporter n=1 Tax=Halopenitus sp. H-Gu1 TaxID=3242697 RepID=UPI00359D1AE9